MVCKDTYQGGDMPTTPINVTPSRRAAQYTGTNSAELAALIDDFTVVSEDATQLTFTSGGQQLTVPRNGYLVWYQGTVDAENVFANADDFHDAYMDVAQAGSHIHEVILTSGPAKAAPVQP